MLKYLFVILFLWSFSLFAQAENRLTIEDIKKFALANNFGVKAINEELEEVKAQTIQKRSVFFPNLSLIAGPEIKTQDNKNDSNTLGYLSGQWSIFRGSQDRVELEISDLNEQIVENNKLKAEFELELEIENLFYQYLYKVTKIKFYQKSVELNQKHKQLIKQKKASGMASQADVMEFELRESLLNSEISSLNQEKEEAKLGLIRLMGPSLQTDFEPFGDLPHLHVKKQSAEFLSQINSTSGSVKSSSLNAAVGSLNLKQSRFAWLPTIDLEMKYGKLPLELAQSYPAFEGAVLLKWNLFSGFATNGKIAESSARANKLEFEFRQRLLTAMTEAEVNYSKLISIQERVHVESGNEIRAEKYYKAVVDEYRRGIKNGADIKAAEELLLLSRTRNAEFRYQFIDNKIRLEKSIGLKVDTIDHE